MAIGSPNKNQKEKITINLKNNNMFKLFKKSTLNNVATTEPNADLRVKTVNEVIEEIHETFYTEVDRLLAEAKIANSLDTDKQDLIEKCARLKALGFTNTKEVKEAEAEIARLDELKRDNETKKTLIEAINYFSFKYPNYKFITEKSVEKICAKYNLVYGEIDRYIGTVPDKNLKHIEDFKVLEDDECFVFEVLYRGSESMKKEYNTSEEFKREQFKREQEFKNYHGYYRYSMLMDRVNYIEINMKCPLEIAAPLKDFNMEGMEVKGHKISKIEIPDPIVLKPVIFNKQKHYLIVTAWGIEAEDELVVNEKFN
jgi:hypothetical protein